ncbi:MAG: FMN-binding protein [Candidatus Cyclobacteriaceae bacterium M2_1C_046]
MSKAATIQKTNSSKMLGAMVGIGALCGLLIVVVYESTLPRVTRLKAEALEQAIFNVIPGITSTKAFTYENGEFVPAEKGDKPVAFAGYDNTGNFKGVAIEASGQGYADILRILYGYDPEKQQVVGFYVLESKETPGLGDKIEKDQRFLDNFTALDARLNEDRSGLINEIIPVKSGAKKNPWEVDGITGATISARAIGNIIGESSKVWVPRIYKNKEVFEMKIDEGN